MSWDQSTMREGRGQQSSFNRVHKRRKQDKKKATLEEKIKDGPLTAARRFTGSFPSKKPESTMREGRGQPSSFNRVYKRRKQVNKKATLEGKIKDGSLTAVKRFTGSFPSKKPESTKKMLRTQRGHSLMCHQCQRNDKGRVVSCSKCERKRFCVVCLIRWYPNLSEDDIARKCPVCRGICNCKQCLRTMGVTEPPIKKISDVDREHHYHYIVQKLLPSLKEIQQEQLKEKEIKLRFKDWHHRNSSYHELIVIMMGTFTDWLGAAIVKSQFLISIEVAEAACLTCASVTALSFVKVACLDLIRWFL